MVRKQEIRVRAQALFDGRVISGDKTVVIEGDTIVEVSSKKGKVDYEGYVTPGLVDAHSHIGMFREGEPGSEQEGNEILHQILPLSDPLDSIYFDDRAFRDAVDFGVLYSCVIPGSGNLFGGRARIIRHQAQHRGEALLKDYGYKMALGYNPRSTQGWKGDRPNTRMGVYKMLEKRFDEILAKQRKGEISRERKEIELTRKKTKKEINSQEYKAEAARIKEEQELELTAEDRALLEVLRGEKFVKVHVHKEDDVLYLIELVKKYGLKVTAEHTGDVFHREIFDLLADYDISIVYGPLGSFAYKVELAHSFYQNTKLLMESKANFGLMTDHPVIHVSALRDSLKYFLMFGMKPAEALSLITRKNAEILGIDSEFGSIKVGMKASLLVWDKDPLFLGAMPRVVIGEGRVLRG